MTRHIGTTSRERPIPTFQRIRTALSALGLAVAVVLALFVWEAADGFSLWDEGFLWYGAQRVLLGEVPIRDFMAYDPGRYYWSAGYMWLTGNNGIMALRESAAIFQVAGVCGGLYLIARGDRLAKANLVYLLVSAVTLAVWMLPRHKVFDASVAILLVAGLALLAETPTPKRCFAAGLCVGLAAVFGRNHGVYAVAASLGIFAWLCAKPGPPLAVWPFVFWAAGIAAGFSPVLAMALTVPGFAAAFWESVRFLFEVRATNLPLPVPWPWRIDLATLSAGVAIQQMLVGLFFIALPAFGVAAIALAIRQRRRGQLPPPGFVAAAFLALPYAHYAYSRADIGHLALGIFPLLIGTLVLLARQPRFVKWAGAGVLAAASLSAALVAHPGWQCDVMTCIETTISNDRIAVDLATAADIALLRGLDQETPASHALVVMPFWPGAYALLGRKAPMWEIYSLFPRPAAFEQAEIARIKAAQPARILLLDLPLDGREELRFRSTHPLTYHYFMTQFEPVPGRTRPPRILLHPKTPQPGAP